MAKKDKNSKAFAQSKRHRRQWLTFVRMCRYGVNNFTRNTWLTIAATAVMTLTLLVVLVTVAAQNILSDTADEIARNIDRSIYLESGTTQEQAAPIIDSLRTLSNVDTVTFVDTDQAREDFAKKNKSDPDTLSAITEATNQFPATIHITLKDPADTSQLVTFVKENETLKEYINTDSNFQPSFMGDRKNATDTIAAWTRTVQEVGIGASAVFVAMSVLIIFNTIRMAIFNRKDEIEMMKLIGADRSFIRGPFVVEAVVYGGIAAFIATGLGIALLFGVHDTVAGWGVSIEPTMTLYTTYVAFVLIGMLLLGALIGAISSLLATRRYLKI